MNSDEKKERQSFRSDWGLAVEIDDYLWRVRLQNKRGRIMVNTYVLKKDDVLAVFDPGWPWTLDALAEALRDSDLGSIESVTHWIYTHSHVDHMGAACLLNALSFSPHYASKWLEPHFKNWHAFIDKANDWIPWSEGAIAEEHIVALFRKEGADRIAKKAPLSLAHGPGEVKNTVLLDVGQTLQLADFEFQILDMRGHDPTHIGFFEKNQGWFISGDAILSTPTPISVAMDDDIDLYRASLNAVLDLDVKLLLPGHGVHKRKNFRRSVERSLRYLQSYESLVIDSLHTDKKVSLMDICLADNPELLDRDATYASVQIALVDSHLQALVRRGIVERTEGPYYQRNR